MGNSNSKKNQNIKKTELSDKELETSGGGYVYYPPPVIYPDVVYTPVCPVTTVVIEKQKPRHHTVHMIESRPITPADMVIGGVVLSIMGLMGIATLITGITSNK
ncbi:MAG: hypothetical protein NkDv07_0830 [Candidatus Improbicoccus devescovinae]|nr:MAG: hypothetical protein NkDv07_0830 [Candidatus Improbicoccus devescovinae]